MAIEQKRIEVSHAYLNIDDRSVWVERAAKALCIADPLSPHPDAPIMWKGKPAKAWEPRAAILRQAIEAGLFCHPPKAWLAPMEATAAMLAATEYLADEHGLLERDAGGVIYEAARDAHTKEQGDEA